MKRNPRLFELMPKEELDAFLALQADAKAWYKAHLLLQDLDRKIIDRDGAEKYFNSLELEASIDMRRRLNTMIQNRKNKKAGN